MPTGRPLPGEYGEHAADDIARVAGDDALDALLAQQREVETLFGSLDDAAVAGNRYAPGKWTVKEVLGHLIDDERIFAYRLLCVARGDMRPLESFDENAYMAGSNFEQRSLANLLDEYRLVRASTIALLRALSADAWLRRGTVAGYGASVRGLAWHIAGHELHHLEILRARYFTPPRAAAPAP
jgi:DinB family protein